MKKFVLYTCFSCLVFMGGILCVNAQTSGTEQATTNISESKINLVSLDVLRFLGFYNLSYTRAISPAISLSLQLETPTNFLLGSVFQETGFGARVEGRWNFSQKNLMGIYLAPIIGFNSSTFRGGSLFTSMGTATNDASVNVTWVALGGMAGYQFAPFQGQPEILAGFGIGAEYNIVNTTTTGSGVLNNATIPTTNTVYPRFRATIGYAF